MIAPTHPPHAARTFVSWRPNWKTELVRRLSGDRDGIFVDVGANVGQTLIDHFVAGRPQGYLGFEPNPECAGFLQHIVWLNRLKNHTIVPAALADHPKIARILIPEGDTASGTLGTKPGHQTKQAEVVCVDFELVRERIGVPTVALAKIDVEGAELEVLKGMLTTIQEQLPPVICEVLYFDILDQGYHARIAELNRLLTDLDYRIFRVLKRGRMFAGFQNLEELPVGQWTPENAEQCDYVFSTISIS
jgi:FkbM family methyltransferase